MSTKPQRIEALLPDGRLPSRAVEHVRELVPDSDLLVTLASQTRTNAAQVADAAANVEAISGLTGEDEAVALLLDTPGSEVRKRAVVKSELVVNVRDFGATGDGTTDDFAAIQAALAAVPASGTLMFPPGHYFTTYRDPADPASYLVVDRGMTWAGQGGVTLENFLIHVRGTYGPLVPIGVKPELGAKQVTTAATHGASAGDYVQLLSVVNAYTSDGGEWQLGSVNPTTGVQSVARYSEIHPVDKADSATTLTLTDEVVYPTHAPTSSGLAYPISGVTASHLRRLGMVRGVTFTGLTFRTVTANNFRSIMARAAADLTFDGCRFESGALPGALVKMTDCHNVRFTRCTSTRSLESFSGSSWNTFVIGGGCHGVAFDGCSFHGEAQTIDFSPNGLIAAADIGADPATGETMRTTQFMSVTNSTFRGCSDGLTSHPSTYLLEVRGCSFVGGSTGIRARSRSSIIQGNTIQTSRVGIALSSFITDALVADNAITQRTSGKYTGWWEGVMYAATSSEIMSDNRPRNVRIVRNTLRPTVPSAANAGINLYHAEIAGYTGLTDEVKVRASDITIADNDFRGCSLRVGKWINAVTMAGNRFAGGSDRAYYITTETDSAGHGITGNVFADASVGAISTGAVTLTGHGYRTTHGVGMQAGFVGMTANLVNTSAAFGIGGDNTLWDGLRLLSGSALSAVRGSGPAMMMLEVVPADGTSAATVRVFGNSPTTGQKTFEVLGRVRPDEVQFPAGPRVHSGTGSPEGVLSAPAGSLYLSTGGTLYVKSSGTGNTGWIAK